MEKRISNIEITLEKAPVPFVLDGATAKIVGKASLVFDGCLYLGEIMICKLDSGYRLLYPTRKPAHESIIIKSSIFKPLNKELAADIEFALITRYEEMLGIAPNSYSIFWEPKEGV